MGFPRPQEAQHVPSDEVALLAGKILHHQIDLHKQPQVHVTGLKKANR